MADVILLAVGVAALLAGGTLLALGVGVAVADVEREQRHAWW